MKWRLLFSSTLLVLIGLLTACQNAGQSGMTKVTITIGGGKAASKAVYRPAVLSKATPTVTTVTFSITGSGMDPVSRTVAIAPPQTVTEVFNLLSGPARTFQIIASAGSVTVYSGSTTLDLNGAPVTMTLPLQTMVFNRLIGSPWNDESTSMARASNGDLLVAGHTLGDLEGNVNADPAHGTFDVFVTRLSSTGGRVWTKQFGTSADDICYGVAVDPNGDIYLAGSTAGDLNGEPAAGLGPINAFVTKLSSTGSHLWTRLTGTAGGRTFGNALTIDNAGNAYLTGDTDGSLGAVNAGLYDVFITKFTSTGLRLWTAQAGSSAADFSEGIALNSAGTALVITGSTRGNLAGANAANGTPTAGTTDVHIHTFDTSTGALSWAVQFGTAADDDAWAVAVDGQGNVYVAGETSGSGILGAPVANAGLSDLFVASYTSAGGFRWVQQLGTSANDVANAITFDPVAGVVVTGRTGGDLQGAGSDGFDDVFVMSLSPSDGSLLWAPQPNRVRQYGTRASDDGIGVSTDGSGNIWVIGNTFGGYTSSATEDIFLLRYDSSGNRVP